MKTTTNEPKRIQRKRTKNWRAPENTVYVGRPTVWGNPFAIADFGRIASIQYFRRWINGENFNVSGFVVGAMRRNELMRRLPELRGKNLMCWCVDGPCHANILLEMANAPDD